MTDDSCAVCGRTILKGEQTRVFLTPEGDRHKVCQLCRGRAEASGWVWEAVAAEQPPPAGPEGRRLSLGSVLRGRARRAGSALRQRGARREDDAGEGPDETVGRGADPAAAGASVRARSEAPPQSRVEQALAEFNGSEHAHRVAGLIRTLGSPQVTVGNGAGAAGGVRITVAWELTWYQWVVKVSAESADVRETAKGQEISELDGPARHWNAHATENGQLQLGRAPARREGEPAAR